MLGHVETIGVIAGDGKLTDGTALGVQCEQVDIVAVLGREIDLAVVLRPGGSPH